jgi:hypothetical protein
MTRPSKKDRERFIALEASKSLGKTWSFSGDRENPDFVVTEGTEQFGLEVSDIFIGPQSNAGSAIKQHESHTQRALNDLRRQYESAENIPLHVRLVGSLDAENIAFVVPELVASDLPSKPIGHHLIIDTGKGLRVHVTKGLRPDWYSVNARVGFVDRDPQKIIADAIEKKSKALPRYRAAVGPDIRLLLIADRIHNSGKMTLEKPAAFDLHGFHTVYFFPYPETALILPDTNADD